MSAAEIALFISFLSLGLTLLTQYEEITRRGIRLIYSPEVRFGILDPNRDHSENIGYRPETAAPDTLKYEDLVVDDGPEEIGPFYSITNDSNIEIKYRIFVSFHRSGYRLSVAEALKGHDEFNYDKIIRKETGYYGGTYTLPADRVPAKGGKGARLQIRTKGPMYNKMKLKLEIWSDVSQFKVPLLDIHLPDSFGTIEFDSIEREYEILPKDID